MLHQKCFLEGLCFRQEWNSSRILLSLAVAFVGSYGCITLYEQFRLCSKENVPKILTPTLLTVLMSFSLGGVAIWCMHFVGMSALTLYDPQGVEVKIRYHVVWTIISLIVVVALAYGGLIVSSGDRIFTKDKKDAIDKFIVDAKNLRIDEIRKMKTRNQLLLSTLFTGMWRLLAGGLLAACGVCVMHFIGMAACVFPGKIKWQPGIIFAFVMIAVVAAYAAFWIMFRLLSVFPNMEALRLGCAIVMAVAVNGMHYTGMAAAEFVYVPGLTLSAMDLKDTMDSATAVNTAIVASAVFMFVVLFVSISDLRTWYGNLAAVVREADTRMWLAQKNVKTRNEVFLSEYAELRLLDGSQKSILEFKNVLRNNAGWSIKGSSSRHSSSGSVELSFSKSLKVVPYKEDEDSLDCHPRDEVIYMDSLTDASLMHSDGTLAESMDKCNNHEFRIQSVSVHSSYGPTTMDIVDSETNIFGQTN